MTVIDYNAIIANAWKSADAINSEGYSGDAKDVYAACIALWNLKESMVRIAEFGTLADISNAISIAEGALSDCPNCAEQIEREVIRERD